MNIREYKNSGIIEDYCLGLLGPAEMSAVAKNAMYYKEIKTAIEEFEMALKKYAEEWIMNDETGEKTNSFPYENFPEEGR